jgi:hypothetical protein
VPSRQEYEARVNRVASALEDLNADVIVLQEIENQAVLSDLNEALSYPVSIIGEIGRPASLDVAILARGQKESCRLPRANYRWSASESDDIHKGISKS